jgi:hypothetical protein
MGCQLGVAHGVLHVTVPEIMLHGAGIHAFVGEVKATRMAEHTQMEVVF